MCGLVGIAGDVDLKNKRLFKGMLDVCQVRGRDSTGVIKVDRDLDYNWIKRVGPPSFLFDTKSYDDIIDSGGTCMALIGHCRHKTSGAINNQTAHPFDFEDEGICGVHNGTLRSYYDLENYSTQRVDSEVLYENIAKHGGVEKVIPKIQGAWALVWWDDNENTLNFLRNAERPLWFAWSKNSRQLYWASETWMFGAVERPGENSGVELWQGDENGNRFTELPVNTLWSFELKKENLNNQNKPLFKLRTPKTIEGRKTEVRGNQGNMGWNQRNRNNSLVSSGGGSGTPNRHGDWVQNPHTGHWTKAPKGGSKVVDPFSADRKRDLLNDPLPTSLQTTAPTPDGKKNTKEPAKESIIPSKNSLVPSTPSTPTTNSEKSSTSQRPRLTLVSQKTNKSERSEDSTGPTKAGFGVSLRNVAGIPYITNNKNGKEYSEEEFDEKTEGKCCFCREPIGDLSEVKEIFSDERFLCKSCVTPNSKVA